MFFTKMNIVQLNNSTQKKKELNAETDSVIFANGGRNPN